MTNKPCKVCQNVRPCDDGIHRCIMGECRRPFLPIDKIEQAGEQLPVDDQDQPSPRQITNP